MRLALSFRGCPCMFPALSGVSVHCPVHSNAWRCMSLTLLCRSCPCLSMGNVPCPCCPATAVPLSMHWPSRHCTPSWFLELSCPAPAPCRVHVRVCPLCPAHCPALSFDCLVHLLLKCRSLRSHCPGTAPANLVRLPCPALPMPCPCPILTFSALALIRAWACLSRPCACRVCS